MPGKLPATSSTSLSTTWLMEHNRQQHLVSCLLKNFIEQYARQHALTSPRCRAGCPAGENGQVYCLQVQAAPPNPTPSKHTATLSEQAHCLHLCHPTPPHAHATVGGLHSQHCPACLTSMTSASGAHSYSSRSFAGADGDLGLQNTPPPWCTQNKGADHGGPKAQVSKRDTINGSTLACAS